MASYSKIKKYYFTVSTVVLAVAVVAAAARNGWELSLRTMIAILTIWFVVCTAAIVMMFVIFNKNNNHKIQ